MKFKEWLEKNTVLVVVAIFAIALAIRLVGSSWGLPNAGRIDSLHPDEPVVQLVSRQIDPLKGKLDPGFYNYGTLYLTMSHLVGASGEMFGPNYGASILAGRMLNILFGALTACLIFLILHRKVGTYGAIFGGLAAAFAPGLTVHSRFQTVDVTATFLVTLALYFAVRLTEGNQVLKWAALGGLAAGLAGGTKYNAVLVLIGIWVAAGLLPKGERLRPILASFLTTLVAFIIATPGALLNSKTFWADFMYEVQHTSEGHGLVFAGTPSGFFYHLSNLFSAYGFLLLLMSLLGIGWAVWRSRDTEQRAELGWLLPAVAFGLVYYLLIGKAEVKFLRYTLPLIPGLCLGFGWLVAQALEAGGKSGRIQVAVAMLALGGFGGGGLSSTAQSSVWMAGLDPRDEAGEYLKKAAAGKSIGLATDPWFYTPTLYKEAQIMRAVFARRSPSGGRVGFDLMRQAVPTVVMHLSQGEDQRFGFDVRLLTEEKPDFVALSSFEFDDLIRVSKLNDEKFALDIQRYREFDSELQKRYEVDKIFGAGGPMIHDMMYIRPRIVVYKRK